MWRISIHAPRVGCDASLLPLPGVLWISIHAPRVGCDIQMRQCRGKAWAFQSTHPVWGATSARELDELIKAFQSTHPVWGATSDENYKESESKAHFNPRTPCGVRHGGAGSQADVFGFQSTHPVWGATFCAEIYIAYRLISIHAPRVGCDADLKTQLERIVISIHAPRVGCDIFFAFSASSSCLFQSTHPVWGATVMYLLVYNHISISIHAPRVGCDLGLCSCSISRLYFNPRTPCGVRRGKSHLLGHQVYRFQSTHPVWGATCPTFCVKVSHAKISIHAPRVGCDTRSRVFIAKHGNISIHAPRVGCDLPQRLCRLYNQYFNPRTPCGVRPRASLWKPSTF